MKMIGIAILLAAFNVSADDCTGQVNGYISGLETASEMQDLNDTEKSYIFKKIENINALRVNKTDCEVRAQIPELANSDIAVQKALDSIKAKKAN